MAYTKEWWERNKQEVLDKRRSRYHSDPEYRQSVLDRSKRYREERKAKAAATPKTITINGKALKALTVAEVYKIAGIDAERLKYYQRQGYVPPALVSRPSRLYTVQQAEHIRQLTDFLQRKADDLRRPQTPEGKAASAQLKGITQAIHSTWEN